MCAAIGLRWGNVSATRARPWGWLNDYALGNMVLDMHSPHWSE